MSLQQAKMNGWQKQKTWNKKTHYTFLAEIQKVIFSCICICQKQILNNAIIKDNWIYISFEKINLT